MRDSSTNNFPENITDVSKPENINRFGKEEENNNQFFSEHEATYCNDLEVTPLWVIRKNRNGFH